MKPTCEEFRQLKLAKPGTILLFEEEGRYFCYGFDALLVAQTLEMRTRTLTMPGWKIRTLFLLSADLAGALSEIKRRHFGIKVEIIR